MRIATLALVGAVSLVLAGCAPVTHPTPTPTATAVFASDEAALTAAEKAYAAYLAASDEVAAAGGQAPERLAPLVTPDRLKAEIENAQLFVANGVHNTGATKFFNSKLEQVSSRSSVTTVVFYTCWDVSNVRVLNSNGRDVTPATREDRITLEVTMVANNHKLPLVLSGDLPWSGISLCS